MLIGDCMELVNIFLVVGVLGIFFVLIKLIYGWKKLVGLKLEVFLVFCVMLGVVIIFSVIVLVYL